MRRRLGMLTASAALAVLTACGGAETPQDGDASSDGATAEAQAPEDFDCEAANGDEDWYAEFCGPGAEEQNGPKSVAWPVGEKRIIESQSYETEGTIQLEVELVKVTARSEECAGPENPVAALLELRVENVGSEPSESGPPLEYYWINKDKRRVDVDGCLGDEPEVPALNPGQNGEGFLRVQVPDEPGTLVMQTAFPFVDSVIELPQP